MTEYDHQVSLSLYRDHPAEGWLSMERYADGLHSGLTGRESCFSVSEWIPPAPWKIPKGMLLTRMFYYPLWARQVAGGVNHIIDHSYGHLVWTLDRTRTVVTVHDVAPLLFPGHPLGLSGLAWRFAWHGTLRAARIIAVSAFTKHQILKHTNLPEEQIIVVPEAVDPSFRPLSEDECRRRCIQYELPPKPRLLHVGQISPRKNIERLLQAVTYLHNAGHPVSLIQVGGTPTHLELQLRAEIGEKYVKFVGRVTHEDLIAFYNLCDILVFPSLYEGFGFPVLEAMACGTPVIASKAASLPEISGDAGILVDPYSTRAIAKAIIRVLDHPGLVHELSIRGLKQAERFTWTSTARKTIAVYEDVLTETR